MADNLKYTPGNPSDPDIATDECPDGSGIHYQVAKLAHGGNGAATLVSTDSGLPVQAVGELVEALEAARLLLTRLANGIGRSLPDASGRLRIAIESIAAAQTLATVTTVGTVTTVTTVTTVSNVANQTLMGGLSAVPQIPSLMDIRVGNLRNKIVVT